MSEKIRNFFTIPQDALSEVRKTALGRNRVSMTVICIMIFGMELFNMARVLLWSSVGLGSLNNRIYFGLYCSLFCAALLYIILSLAFRSWPVTQQLALQYVAVFFVLWWHVCMNAYDISQGHSAEVGIYYTAVLGMATFILMPQWLALLAHTSAYALLVILVGRLMDGGTFINITFTSIVALAISLTSCRYHAVMIAQRLEIGRMNSELRLLARRDPLTGLLNRDAFERLARPRLEEGGVTLLIVDLDNFKSINDLHGHPCGDYVLRETAHLVEDAFPDALGTARIGGDEFAVLLSGADGKKSRAGAQRLIRSVAATASHGKKLGAGCSVGGCGAEAPGAAFERLYDEADRALYEAKARGKSQFYFNTLSQ